MSSASEAKRKKAVITTDEFLERSKSDRSFYFRNAIKIRPKHARHLVHLEMRPGQQKLMDVLDRQRAKGRPGRVIILKARQIGFSTVTDMELFRLCHLFPHQQALIAAHKAESAEYLFENIKRAYDNLPESIRPEKKYSTKRLIHYEENDSRLEVAVANEARGFTAQIIHISELAFIDKAADFMTAIMQTAPDEPESIVVVESTPNGIGNEFHDLWVRAVSGNSEWEPLFIPWFDEPSYQRKPWFEPAELELRLDDSGKRAAEIVRLHGVSQEQIAWWLHTLENKCFGELDRMEQEYPTDPITCFMASGSKVFDSEGIKHYVSLSGLSLERAESQDERRTRFLSDSRWHTIEANPGDVKHPHVRLERGGRLWMARKPIPKHKYIVAFDLSGGDPGSDRTPGVVLNRHTLNLDAVMDIKMPPEVCAEYAFMLGWYYNRAQTFGEANNHGILFHHVLMDKLKYPNIYFRKTSESSVAGRVTDKPGFYTQGENREHLFNLVRRYVREKSGLVEFEPMVMEWVELRRDEKSQRIDHPDGGSSDYTMALGVALAVHMGSFDGSLAPLTLEENDAVAAAYDRLTEARAFGRDLSEVDIQGMTIDDVDRLHDKVESVRRRRVAAGLEGMR